MLKLEVDSSFEVMPIGAKFK